MAASFDFNQEDLERHTCRTWQEGDWIILQCTQCDFLRRMNWKTGALKIDQSGEPQIMHSAQHRGQKIALDVGSMN
ncbi:hypothetical protein [Flavilitoribacter nigricans]|uniref:Uncharacterized protein n=1 Tax=Flavilitoribacter nigricans (strain ATCC 23147 / DSM 23189 / NBRC 102662 / NCIMB 1420 / SS-2) TaxID=1122177 RepID=A0A2D0N6Q3_FLAN2|nr:hypothetical protein [Flavilitoribacter nigricans]PHN04137.1 hypothetical protein CRP01_23355 [Flavilitoribacter nigricans DSM 23189 = NBRC 102662]